MAVHDDCKLKFLELKAKRTYRLSFIRLRRSRSKLLWRSLGSQPMVMMISLPVFLLMSVDMLFMILILSLKRIARKAEFSSLLGIVNLLALIQTKQLLTFRSPDTSRVRSKMIYASSKDRFKRELDGIQIELQATDPTEMGLDVFRSRAN
ncbi:ADF-H/Gelsolin-like domain superfamily [Sesbania bispinosa]|nr:ADF-H/Gelsolin-like domain superfamily [Sesbania bispinosa]